MTESIYLRDRSNRTVKDLVHNAARRFPFRTALILPNGRRVSYSELRDRTVRLANAFLAAGITPGDRVATWMADGLEYVEVYLACAHISAVVVPINSRFVGQEAQFQIDNAKSRCLIWTHDMDAHVSTLSSKRDLVTIVVGPSDIRADHEYERLLSDGSTQSAGVDVSPDDLFILGYTSGTTGRPKAAMMTHRTTLAAGRLNGFSLRLTGQSVHALTGSMSFVSVVPGHVLAVLALGGTLIILGRWDVESLAATIEAERATFTYIPSPVMSDFHALAERRPEALISLNSIVHSASKGHPDRILALIEAIGPHRYIESWGMTEHSGAGVTATVPEDYTDPARRRAAAGSVGRPTVDAAVRLVDAFGGQLDWDGTTVGELIVWSPALMTGYWNQPEATEQAFLDGWYRTGDLGSIDPDGFVVISDRRTDLIVSGGMNVYPSEVEAVIQRMPEVLEVTVVGLPHERWGQTVTAVVVRAPGAELSAEKVIDHCRHSLAGFKKPTRVEFVSELPRTASLKISRAAVRKAVEEGQRTS
jgi:fatty-acyl-CoA synthase